MPHPPDAACGLECEGADELGQREVLFSERIAGPGREGAGAIRFTGYMRRDGKARADALPGGKLEHLMVPRRQLDQLSEPGPGEADAGEMASAVHRVQRPELLLVEIVDPVGWIVREPDGWRWGFPDVHMVREGEIGESHFHADFGKQVGEVRLPLHFTHIAYERIYPVEHVHCGRAGRSKHASSARRLSSCPRGRVSIGGPGRP